MSEIPAEGSEVAELQAEIEQTREDLARTVDQLAAKADVKGRVGRRAAGVGHAVARRAANARDRATGPHGRPTTASLVIIFGVSAAVAARLVWRRSGHGRRARPWER